MVETPTPNQAQIQTEKIKEIVEKLYELKDELTKVEERIRQLGYALQDLINLSKASENEKVQLLASAVRKIVSIAQLTTDVDSGDFGLQLYPYTILTIDAKNRKVEINEDTLIAAVTYKLSQEIETLKWIIYEITFRVNDLIDAIEGEGDQQEI